jgi:hypothetical protein
MNLNQGENLLAVRAVNRAGPAGLLVHLNLGGTETRQVVSDTQWLVTDREQPGWNLPGVEVSTWRPAVRLGAHGSAPWGDVLTRASAPPASSLKLLPGFAAELLRSAEPGGGVVGVPGVRRPGPAGRFARGGRQAAVAVLLRRRRPDCRRRSRAGTDPFRHGPALRSWQPVRQCPGPGRLRSVPADRHRRERSLRSRRGTVAEGVQGRRRTRVSRAGARPGRAHLRPQWERHETAGGHLPRFPAPALRRGRAFAQRRRNDAGGRRPRARMSDPPHRSRGSDLGAGGGGHAQRLRLRFPTRRRIVYLGQRQRMGLGHALVPPHAGLSRRVGSRNGLAGRHARLAGSLSRHDRGASSTSASVRRAASSSAPAPGSPASTGGRCISRTGPTAASLPCISSPTAPVSAARSRSSSKASPST